MKRTRFILSILILVFIAFSFIPSVIPQKDTYTFQGAEGNEKVLKVNTVDEQGLELLFGMDWQTVIFIFGDGADEVGARTKSVVTGVNFDATFGGYDVTTYTTNNWDWTTGDFPEDPDSTGTKVISFYDPNDLTEYINNFYTALLFTSYDVSMHTAGIYLAQLPTPVDEYLAEITWVEGWHNDGTTIVHNAKAGDTIFLTGIEYFEDCTEVWTYDATYGAWIGYKILNSFGTTIYEFAFEVPGLAIPGFELSLLLGASVLGIIYIIFRKRK